MLKKTYPQRIFTVLTINTKLFLVVTILALLLIGLYNIVYSQGGIIDTVVGGGIVDNLPATQAPVPFPDGIAFSPGGDLYVASYEIYKIDASGTLWLEVDQDSGNIPLDIDTDASGNLYIADRNFNIVKVDTSGVATIVAGSGVEGFYGDGGPATSAMLDFVYWYPTGGGEWMGGIEVDTSGNLYIADSGNHRIRKVDTNGIITTAAGFLATPGFSGDGGPAVYAQLNGPSRVALDSAGNLFIADKYNHCIRKVDTSGIITTVVGNRVEGYSGDGGQATSAQLSHPSDIALDLSGNMYIADSGNHRVRKVDTSGIITTVAGNGTYDFSGDGGPAINASLKHPRIVTLDSSGNLYIADYQNDRVRKVDSSGMITTVVGNGKSPYYFGDGGPATKASLFLGVQTAGVRSVITFDPQGNMYVTDINNYAIRKVDTSGIITTFKGTGFSFPSGITSDSSGNIYISATYADIIQKIDTSGTTTKIAGTGTGGFGGDNGPAINAQLYSPQGLASDTSGNIYIADMLNHRIRKIDTNGTITTVAGNGTMGFSGDGGAATSANLNRPRGLAFDSNGNLFIADTGNSRVRRVDTSGVITTIAGNGQLVGDSIPAINAKLYEPLGIAVDSYDRLFIADPLANRIRMIDLSGIIKTIAGTGTLGFSGDGGPAIDAEMDNPSDVVIDQNDILYIADSGNNRIRSMPVPPDLDFDGLDDNFESEFGGNGITVVNPLSTPPNMAYASGSASSGATITSGDVTVKFPPGTAVDESSSSINIIYSPYPSPKVEVSGADMAGGTKWIKMPFNEVSSSMAVCIQDSINASISTVLVDGVCQGNMIEILDQYVPNTIDTDGNQTPYTVTWTRSNPSLVAIEGLSYSAIAPIADMDLDKVVDNKDNCTTTPNFDQMDNNSDGQGDACDPIIESISITTELINIFDQPITISGTFTDTDDLDSHTAIWDWGDGSQSVAIVYQDTNIVSGNHTYNEPGVYVITLTISDGYPASDQASYEYIVIYNSDGGFVTGGGWFDSPGGAYVPDPTLIGKATFGFVSKYKKGQSVPTGVTEFQFKMADLNFHSETYQWLVIAGPKAIFKGTGTINGNGNYGFMISAIDENLTPSTDVDMFRIKIWDKDNGDVIVYDNQIGDPEDADPTTTIGGGSIVIHNGN